MKHGLENGCLKRILKAIWGISFHFKVRFSNTILFKECVSRKRFKKVFLEKYISLKKNAY